jgi:molybdopterin-guanine dinucleotide biosynthesis protein MobB
MRLKKNKNNFFFHPFEITFSGFSNSGKTTLISKLTEKLSSQFDIGYLKHDAHKFDMDKKGKDTDIISNCGAKTVLINDQSHFAHLQKAQLEQIDVTFKMQDMDILFIEGHKLSKLPKMLFIPNDQNRSELIDLVNKSEISEILGIISDNTDDPFEGKYPFFQRDETERIINFILDRFKNLQPTKLNGLVLTGGKSERMNQDKGSLTYHGHQNQIDFSTELLEGFCDEVYVSCRTDQSSEPFLKDHNLLFDSFPSAGPTTGILSAQYLDKTSAWLVLACDLPYLDKETIQLLIEKRNPYKLATAFMNPKRNWPEPLCTIYEPKSYQKLIQYFSINKPCPRKVLFNSNIEQLQLENTKALDNVNTTKEKQEALSFLNTKKGKHEG